ncbi:hypothetical protein QTP88_015155 [Uroleucon formosanum]
MKKMFLNHQILYKVFFTNIYGLHKTIRGLDYLIVPQIVIYLLVVATACVNSIPILCCILSYHNLIRFSKLVNWYLYLIETWWKEINKTGTFNTFLRDSMMTSAHDKNTRYARNEVTACDLWEVCEPIRANSALTNIILPVTRQNISSKNNSDNISLLTFKKYATDIKNVRLKKLISGEPSPKKSRDFVCDIRSSVLRGSRGASGRVSWTVNRSSSVIIIMAHNRISAAAAETVTRFDEDGGKINCDDSHFLREVVFIGFIYKFDLDECRPILPRGCQDFTYAYRVSGIRRMWVRYHIMVSAVRIRGDDDSVGRILRHALCPCVILVYPSTTSCLPAYACVLYRVMSTRHYGQLQYGYQFRRFADWWERNDVPGESVS